LELFSKQETGWKRAHDIDFVYDALQLSTINDEVWLFGFIRESQNNQEGAVYSFQWRNGRFNYQNKKNFSNFAVFLATLPSKRTDYLSPEYMVFPPHPEQRGED
jgi:hypothetical protein